MADRCSHHFMAILKNLCWRNSNHLSSSHSSHFSTCITPVRELVTGHSIKESYRKRSFFSHSLLVWSLVWDASAQFHLQPRNEIFLLDNFTFTAAVICTLAFLWHFYNAMMLVQQIELGLLCRWRWDIFFVSISINCFEWKKNHLRNKGLAIARSWNCGIDAVKVGISGANFRRESVRIPTEELFTSEMVTRNNDPRQKHRIQLRHDEVAVRRPSKQTNSRKNVWASGVVLGRSLHFILKTFTMAISMAATEPLERNRYNTVKCVREMNQNVYWIQDNNRR